MSDDVVLVFDDRTDIVEGVQTYLEAVGVASVGAQTVDEAWRVLKEAPDRISKALVDKSIQRDEGAGIQFVVEAREVFPTVEFFLMSAHHLSDRELQVVTESDIVFLEKPIAPSRLLDHLGLTPPARTSSLTAPTTIPAETDATAMTRVDELKDQLFHSQLQGEVLSHQVGQLRTAWDRHTESLVQRLLSVQSPVEESLVVNGRSYSAQQLVEEVASCTPVGEAIVSLHYEIVDDLFDKMTHKTQKR